MRVSGFSGSHLGPLGIDNPGGAFHVAPVKAQRLDKIEPNTKIIVGGDSVVAIPAEVAERFKPGDCVAYVEETEEVLLIPAAETTIVGQTVGDACQAFEEMRLVTDEQINLFYGQFAEHLEDPKTWAEIARVNRQDVLDAKARGRSTTRLEATDSLRDGMILGLRGWAKAPVARNRVIERVQHKGWSVELQAAQLGVVAFVFEGRPNVLSDATGVLKGGNTVVFRIGRDALPTAQAIMTLALTPALLEAGLPAGAVGLVKSVEHAAGWALFRDSRVSLAVARGSGRAVAVLGSLARQSGVPVSLHGTGGAWMTASPQADVVQFEQSVFDSLDRKVCNTLNVCCIPREASATLVPAFLAGLKRAAERRGKAFKLHVVQGDENAVPAELFRRRVLIGRAAGDVEENQAQQIAEQDLGREWEWEDSPEVTLKLVDSIADATKLFNQYSPQFVACLVSPDFDEQQRFYDSVNAPFVGDGYTRWVDGQFALGRPELGLSNWENGRLLARAGVLSGDSIHTIRTRVRRD